MSFLNAGNISNDRENLNSFLVEAELEQYYELFRDILKVSKLSQLKYVVLGDLVQIGLSKPEQRRYKKIYSKYFPNPYISKIKKILGSKKNEVLQCQQGPSSMPLEVLPFSENNVIVPTKHIISIEDITINKELGMGQFGVVQQGIWTTGNQRLQVAIKCLGHERMMSNSTEFLKEAAVMHSIEHPNIVRLYGVVLHLDSLMLVTELAPLRSLLECLREVSLRTDFPVPNLCVFAEQICDGMTYLEKKRLIHRDLASRNILVFSKDSVKISDFGLSRALGVGKDYYQTNYNVNLKLPVAWCAPECILYLRFTSSSDVWAFGVCLWEMFTYGFQPWAAFSGQQILEAIDDPKFQRLERPECCPESYYETMLECWAHDPNKRPKFRDLSVKLKGIRPEQVEAIADYVRPEDSKKANNMLDYKCGQQITVLGKEAVTKTMTRSMWYGVLPGGACGWFDPTQTKPYEKGSHSISPHLARHSSRHIRTSLRRSDVTRHTYTGKRAIHRHMISGPQGDLKHTGHVGLDGAYFGDVSFLDPAGRPPRQIVTPYKASEDLEQQPLINPNSPSHLTGAGTSPYPLLTPNTDDENCDDDMCVDVKTKSSKKTSHKSISEPTTSKSILNKVKSATLGRSHKTDGAGKDDVHEYYEISDEESNATDTVRTEILIHPESPGAPKSYADFGQSLLAEMDAIFRNIDGKKRDEAGGSGKHFCIDSAVRSHTLNKMEKKKAFQTGTMKPMSAHDEKTLETAVALANEITTKSMNDLGSDQKSANSLNDKTKFHFKFPQLTLHVPHDPDIAKLERRNFSQEAKNVPDIQATITEESKLAYTSLIEEPSYPGPRHLLMPKPAPRDNVDKIRSMEKARVMRRDTESDHQIPTSSKNILPLPPRSSKPKLVDKPRHYRKYPLRIYRDLPPKPPPKPAAFRTNLYQNARPQVPTIVITHPTIVVTNGTDVCDGNASKDAKNQTNPFARVTPSANPFDWSNDVAIDSFDDDDDDDDEAAKDLKGCIMLKDCTDHVSVEDLLEFADLKPCGRQRGVESDEVRIMSKVLKELVTPEECLEALELSDWNVYLAIKVVRLKMSAGIKADLQLCFMELENASGDVAKATTVLINKEN